MTRIYRILFYTFFICLQLLVLGINFVPASIGLRYLALNKGNNCPANNFFIVYAVCALLSSVCEVFALFTIQEQEHRRQFSDVEDEDEEAVVPPSATPEPDQRLQSSVVILLVILSSVFKWTCAIMALRLSMGWHSNARAQSICAEGTGQIVQLFGYISFFQTISGFVVLVICARCVCMCCGPQPVAAEEQIQPPIAAVKDIEMLDTPVASVILWVKDGTVPPQFRCSLSNQVMKDPVVAADGYSYEREVITARLKAGTDRLADGRALSPVTGRPLRHLELIPNHSLRSWIAEWQAREAVANAAANAAEPSPKNPRFVQAPVQDGVAVKKKNKPFGSPCSSGVRSDEAITVTVDVDDTTSHCDPASSSQLGSPGPLSRSAQLGFLTPTHSGVSGSALHASLRSITSTTSDAAAAAPAALLTQGSTASSKDSGYDSCSTGSSSKSSKSLSRSGSVGSGLAAAVASALAAAPLSPWRRFMPSSSHHATTAAQLSTQSSAQAGDAEEPQQRPPAHLPPPDDYEREGSVHPADSPLPVVQVVLDRHLHTR